MDSGSRQKLQKLWDSVIHSATLRDKAFFGAKLASPELAHPVHLSDQISCSAPADMATSGATRRQDFASVSLGSQSAVRGLWSCFPATSSLRGGPHGACEASSGNKQPSGGSSQGRPAHFPFVLGGLGRVKRAAEIGVITSGLLVCFNLAIAAVPLPAVTIILAWKPSTFHSDVGVGGCSSTVLGRRVLAIYGLCQGAGGGKGPRRGGPYAS